MIAHRAVILTAIPTEYQAVRAHLSSLAETTHPQGTVYETGIFECPGREPWSVTIVEIGAGNPGAAIETERAARFVNPEILMFVGVAGGIKDVELCDVVVATKVYGYEAGKSEEDFRPRPSVGESSYPLVQRARAEARKDDWIRRAGITTSNSPSQRPRVIVAPIAAGEKVVASRRSEVFQFLREQYGDAVAVEMEGRGFLMAAHANAGIDALIVRGISDLLGDKSEADRAGFQERAVDHASAFAFEILAKLAKTKASVAEYVLVLTATMAEIDRPRAEAIVAHLRELTGDARLTIKRVEEGSVRIVAEGSRDGYELLKSLAETGELSFKILAKLAETKANVAEYVLVLTATIDEVDRPRAEAIVAHLRELTGDARLTLKRVEEGSVRIVAEGSRDGYELLRRLSETGELSEVLGTNKARLMGAWTSLRRFRRSEDILLQAEQFIDEVDFGER